MKSQKEITLRDDLELRDRTDIYRNFLLYCMSGDTVALPMGSTVVVERDASEFARLSQLGDILGAGRTSNMPPDSIRSHARSAIFIRNTLILCKVLLYARGEPLQTIVHDVTGLKIESVV